MKIVGTCSRICCLFVLIFLCATSDVRSQDLFSEMDQLKRELSDVKGQLDDLRSQVYELRRAVLKSATAPARHAGNKVPPKEEKVVKQEKAPDEQELTRVICGAAGKFFLEAEAILAESDSSAAEARMNKAMQSLHSTLQPHASTHRGNKIIQIYEGLAWDAYVAVELRHSVQGNEEFIQALRKHKQMYLETCPKE